MVMDRVILRGVEGGVVLVPPTSPRENGWHQ